MAGLRHRLVVCLTALSFASYLALPPAVRADDDPPVPHACTCDIDGVTSVCQGDQDVLYTTSTSGINGATYLWSQVSGPAVSFDTPAASSTNVDFGAAGTVRIRCVITDDGSGECEDCTPIYDIVVTASPTANAGPDQEICETSTVQLAGTSNGSNCTWTASSGINGGTFNPNANDLNAIYSPSATDIANGTVTLTLTCTAVSPCTGSPAVDSMDITINANPICTITASDPCENSTGSASVATAFGAAFYDWTITGNGTQTSADGSTSVTYSTGPVANGPVTIMVTITDGHTPACTCTSTKIVNVLPKPNATITHNAGPELCPNWAGYVASVPAIGPCGVGGPATYLWTISTGGTIVGSATLPSVSFKVGTPPPTSVTLSVTVTGCNGCSTTNSQVFNVCTSSTCQSGKLRLIGPSGGCYKNGDFFNVELWMEDVTCPAAGFQAFLKYDSARVQYVAECFPNPIVSSTYTTTPFSLQSIPICGTVGSLNHPVLGKINLSNGTNVLVGNVPVTGTHKLATLKFQVISNDGCDDVYVDFRPDPYTMSPGDTSRPPTRLTDLTGFGFGTVADLPFSDGGLLVFAPASIRIDGTAPSVSTGTIAACYDDVPSAEAAAVAATGATDNCSPCTLTKTASSSGATCDIVITVTVEDCCGNTAQTTYNTRIDNTAPTITCPTSPVTVECNVSTLPTNTGTASATDNCLGDPTITFSDDIVEVPLDFFVDGTGAMLNYAGGQLHMKSTFTAPSDYGVTAAIWYAPTAFNFEDLTKLSIDYTQIQGCFGGGSPRFSVRIDMDANGIESPADKSLWIYLGTPSSWNDCPVGGPFSTGDYIDVGAPNSFDLSNFSGPFNGTYGQALLALTGKQVLRISLAVDAGWSQPPGYVQEFNFDNWMIEYDTGGGPVAATFTMDGACADYDIARTWTATDSCGNASSCVQTIQVRDTIGPVITCPPDVTIECSDSSDPNLLGVANVNGFDVDPVVSPTQAAGAWYTDRYAPFGFVRASFLGNDRLKHSIDASDCETCRPGGFNNSFYNTQGRKYDISGTTQMSIQLYVPSAWASTGRRMAGLWGTGFDSLAATASFPIIEFTSSSDGSGLPRFRGWDSAGAWIDMGLPAGFAYDAWYTLKIELVGANWRYTVGDLQLLTSAFGAVEIENVILQGHNNLTGVTYDIYWDNFSSTVPQPATAIDNCDPAPVITYTDVPLLGGCDGTGTIQRTWHAVDACGNPSTCLQTITVVDTTAPIITCAANVVVNPTAADLLDCDADDVNIVAPTASDNCDALVTPVGIRSDTFAVVTPGPNSFPPGVTTITWTATDDCTNAAICVQTVTVNAVSIAVNVELSPTIDALPVQRCITFQVFSCPIVTPQTVSMVLNFTNQGGDAIANGTICVPVSTITCVTARDTLHTLRSRVETGDGLVGVGPTYTANFLGARAGEPGFPLGTGHRLVGGNLNDDEYIDILDFGTWAGEYLTIYPGAPNPGDTTCSTTGPHADITGDGTADSGDFSFIGLNFLMFREANCCGLLNAEPGAHDPAGDRPRSRPITRISVQDLHARGMATATAGDINHDGWVDMNDVMLAWFGLAPPTQPAPVDQPVLNPKTAPVTNQNPGASPRTAPRVRTEALQEVP